MLQIFRIHCVHGNMNLIVYTLILLRKSNKNPNNVEIEMTIKNDKIGLSCWPIFFALSSVIINSCVEWWVVTCVRCVTSIDVHTDI